MSVEASCGSSEGAIDVLLNGEETTIAFEVSVTTSAAHELENLSKCLGEPIDHIVCVSPVDQHRLEIQNLCLERLSHKQNQRITFLRPQSVSDFVKQFDERETTLIRGYEVVTRTVQSDPRDVEYRKSRIRQVLGQI